MWRRKERLAPWPSSGSPPLTVWVGNLHTELGPAWSSSPLTLWHLSLRLQVTGWELAGGGAGEKVRDWRAQRAGTKEGVEHKEESFRGKVSSVSFPYDNREGGLGQQQTSSRRSRRGLAWGPASLRSSGSPNWRALPGNHMPVWGQRTQHLQNRIHPPKPRIVTLALRVSSLSECPRAVSFLPVLSDREEGPLWLARPSR